MSTVEDKRVRRSADDWREILAQQRSSGLSQAAFCRREAIALSTFARWKQRLGSPPDADSCAVSGDPGWIELPSIGQSGSGWLIELDLGGGICLRLKPA